MSMKSVRTHMFLKILRKARFGTVKLKLPGGNAEIYGEGLPVIEVEIKKWNVIDQLFSRGDLGLAEAIIEGELHVSDTAALVEWACKNDRALGQALSGTWYGTLMSKLKHYMNRNDVQGAKKNIVAHYDLGNEFYKLWLDPSMTYSSAIFRSPDQDLQSAQNAKYDRIIEELNLKSGDHVLEIGCGWGGFFSRAVERTGCKVTAVMNSPQQARHNQKKIQDEKMQDHIELLQKDYRHIEGHFDKIVSIEMIEAVGEKYWDTYFSKVSASLKNRGAALIQGITIREDLFYSYRKNTDFIQQYVFPGGMLLTNKTFAEKGTENNLPLADSFEFGFHYAETLRRWRENFNSKTAQLASMGFDDKFIRLWNFYLAYCEGAFRSERISVGQYLLQR